jgi:membrane protein implicated in regulation of membrane protease activity
MQGLIDFLYALGPWNWFLIAGIFLALEIMVPGVYLLWFGLAAAIVGALAFAMGMDWHAQLILFAAIAVVLLFLVRKFLGSGPTLTDSPDLNVRGAQYVGRVFTVEEAIRGGRGKIRVGDTVWLAKGPDLPKGTSVRVTSVDGTMLVVEAAGL